MTVARDFDRIAALTPPEDLLGPHEEWLLAQLPARRGTALEIGCGAGAMSRRLAQSFERVTAIDLSPGMIEKARRMSPPSIEYHCTSMEEWLARGETYDCIVSVATLHHQPLEPTLRAMADALRPGGRLLVLDILDRGGVLAVPVNAVAWLVSRWRYGFMPRALAEAWREHGRNERYLTIREARDLTRILPGASVREHLLWRYSLVWDK
jgi:2-polyprenyl-3-methyl-5-hydroxy-6-metoxy-1,4-benzoquinol methylase